jgi:subtilisin inhibitor-like
MRRTLSRALVAAALGAFVVIAPAAAAHATGANLPAAASADRPAVGPGRWAVTPGRGRGNTYLALSITFDDGSGRAAWLGCAPARGSHPKAARACGTLAAVAGDPAAIPDREGVCPMVYAPVTARATGRWHGTAVHYRERFTNSCAMTLGTDGLFEF